MFNTTYNRSQPLTPATPSLAPPLPLDPSPRASSRHPKKNTEEGTVGALPQAGQRLRLRRPLRRQRRRQQPRPRHHHRRRHRRQPRRRDRESGRGRGGRRDPVPAGLPSGEVVRPGRELGKFRWGDYGRGEDPGRERRRRRCRGRAVDRRRGRWRGGDPAPAVHRGWGAGASARVRAGCLPCQEGRRRRQEGPPVYGVEEVIRRGDGGGCDGRRGRRAARPAGAVQEGEEGDACCGGVCMFRPGLGWVGLRWADWLVFFAG